MDEKTISKIAAVCVFVGMLVLFLFLQSTEIEFATLSEMEEDDTVVFEGVVMGKNEMDSVTFLMVQSNEITSVTLFGPIPYVDEGTLIQVRGEVDVYKGKKSILGEEIRIIG